MSTKRRPSAPLDYDSYILTVLGKVSPQVVLAGMLGATAAYGGLTPPFTRLLQIMNTKIDLGADLKKAGQNIIDSGQDVVDPFHIFHKKRVDTPAPPKTAEEKKSDIAKYSLAASGALEAMMMMTLVENKELMNQMFKTGTQLASSVIEAVGDAVPF
jgi:hypothetical protein